jgi:hypothetical protein
LAFVERGGFVPTGDPAVARFRSVLDQLSSKYAEGSGSIADVSIATQKALREKGLEESLLNIMEGLNQLGGPLRHHLKHKYADWAAVYVKARGREKDHGAAIRSILNSSPR